MTLLSSLMPTFHTMTAAVNEQTAELFQFHRGQDVFFMLMLVAFLMMFIYNRVQSGRARQVK